MLDAFRKITGGDWKTARRPSEELQELIASAKEERAALTTMLNALAARTTKLLPLSTSLEEIADRAAAIGTQLDDIGRRVRALDARTSELATRSEPSITDGRSQAAATLEELNERVEGLGRLFEVLLAQADELQMKQRALELAHQTVAAKSVQGARRRSSQRTTEAASACASACKSDGT